MNFIVRGRQQGKTHDLIGWARGHADRLIVVPTRHDQERLTRLRYLPERGGDTLPAEQVVTVLGARLMYERGRVGNIALGVDDLDRIISNLLGVNTPIELVTATGVVL